MNPEAMGTHTEQGQPLVDTQEQSAHPRITAATVFVLTAYHAIRAEVSALINRELIINSLTEHIPPEALIMTPVQSSIITQYIEIRRLATSHEEAIDLLQLQVGMMSIVSVGVFESHVRKTHGLEGAKEAMSLFLGNTNETIMNAVHGYQPAVLAMSKKFEDTPYHTAFNALTAFSTEYYNNVTPTYIQSAFETVSKMSQAEFSKMLANLMILLEKLKKLMAQLEQSISLTFVQQSIDTLMKSLSVKHLTPSQKLLVVLVARQVTT